MRLVAVAAAAAGGAAAVAIPDRQQQVPLTAVGSGSGRATAAAALAGSGGTVYELIRGCAHTSRFADRIDWHPPLVALLNSSRAQHTLFVPTNDAFEHGHGPLDDDDYDSDVVAAAAAAGERAGDTAARLLRYHIGLGRFPAARIFGAHTLPTALREELLGGEPQRLRTSIGLRGVAVNRYSTVVAADIKASNGVIHAVDRVLRPPLMVGRTLSLFPAQFSTLLLAYDRTGFVDYIHGVDLVGSTVLAPSNAAFARLGARANAFLFNTDTGRRYLRALLRYHVVPNATLYSDAFYHATGATPAARRLERRHYDLRTLLGDAHVAVDVLSLGDFSIVRVNGFAHVTVRDGVAKNGVIQVLDQVLLPPCKEGASDHAGDVPVARLKARLEPYL